MIRLAVSIGCPCGIGPEVSVVAASRLARALRDEGGEAARARVVLVGDAAAVRAAAELRKISARRVVRVGSAAEAWSVRAQEIPVLEPTPPLASKDRRPGRPGPAAGAAQLAWIDAATELVRSGAADALVTGPVSKEAIARSGAEGSAGFLGHTEHLAERLGAPEVTMAFHVPGGLTTSLVTTHLPLARVPHAVTPAAVARAAYWTARFVDRMHDASARRDAQAPGAGRRDPRAVARPPSVAVAALNPHAGEGGLLGDEESVAIAPGIERARLRLARDHVKVTLAGPLPAESAFRLAAKGAHAAVVAMYHDQATIPMKLLGFGEAVNVSLGLPIVRTSVDHGTAYDRAGKGTADARGMLEALRLAALLVTSTKDR